MNVQDLIASGEAPAWLTEEGFATLSGGYLSEGETPRAMYRRVAKAAASYYADSERWEAEFFDAMWRNWLCPATPVLTNLGTTRGLPISCLTGDVWVSTETGAKQVRDIEVGDKVLTHTGKFRHVTAKQSRMSSGDLFEVKVNTRQTKTRITGNHPVLTNHGWVRVDELDPKKHLVATSYKVDIAESEYTIDMQAYCKYPVREIGGKLYKAIENHGPEHKKKKNGIVEYYCSPFKHVPVDEDVAWFLGLWLAEGSLSKNARKNPCGIRVTLGKGEVHLAEKWLHIAKSRFGLDGNYYLSEVQRDNFAKGKPTSWVTVDVNGGPIGHLFLQEFGNSCKTKTLPEWLVRLPRKQLLSLLDGLLLGDGHKRANGTHELTLANPKLLMGVYNIYLKLGRRVSLQMQAKPSSIGKTKYVYKLHELSESNIRLSKYSSNQGVFFNDLYFCSILQLDRIPQDEEVFDLTVDGDHSFTANGFIVHNCNSIHTGDSVDNIFMKAHELAMLSKNAAGVAVYLGDVRGRGAPIKGNGVSEGVIPWAKIFDQTTVSVSQGSSRRGASALYLPIDHRDIDEFIDIRRPTGDPNRRCLNTNHGVCISDAWMESMLAGDHEKRELWLKILNTRVQTGEPYLFFTDTVNKANPPCYVANGLKVSTSNICCEISLHTDIDHTFVCCLSSLNVARWDEWKDTDLPGIAVRFLDAVISEYIEKTENVPGLEPARRSAIKGRAIGVGVLGWHTLLQEKGIPFEGFRAMALNADVFRTIQEKTDAASRELAVELGEPEWCRGHGVRNTHLRAIAPTVSNSAIAGGYSAGIEPIAANIYTAKGAKGTFIRKNATLEKLLREKGFDTPEVWKSILTNEGSMMHLDFLTEEEKAVFLTAREINQFAIVRQAAQRQQFIDQAQSVNLFFAQNASAKYIHDVHIEAWQLGLKTLYYMRSTGVLKGDLASRSKDECLACEG